MKNVHCLFSKIHVYKSAYGIVAMSQLSGLGCQVRLNIMDINILISFLFESFVKELTVIGFCSKK